MVSPSSALEARNMSCSRASNTKLIVFKKILKKYLSADEMKEEVLPFL